MHFDAKNSVALAGLASSAFRIERIPAGLVAARLRFREVREQIPNVRENSREGGWVRSRRAADRRLVDVDDLIDVGQSFDSVEVSFRLAGTVYAVFEHGQKRVHDQARLPGARHSGHTGEHAERKRHRQIAKIVGTRSAQDQAALFGLPATVSYTHLRAHETDSYLVC